MEKTDEQLAKILQKGIEVAEKSGQFVLDQAPDLIQQLLLWKTMEYALTILMSIGLFLITYRWFRSMKKRDIKFIEEAEGLIFSIIFLVDLFVLIPFISSLYNLLQILVAPKIWLIEYTIDLIN